MRRLLFLLFAGIILTFLLQCKTTSFTTSSIAKEWMLVEFKNYNKEEFIRKNIKVVIHPSTTSLLKGEIVIDCNHFSFTGRIINNEKIKILNLKRLGAECQGSYLEKDFLQEFSQVSAYKRQGHFLILTNKAGVFMKFLESDWD